MADQKGADAHDAPDFAANASTFKAQGYNFVAQYIDLDKYGDASRGGNPGYSSVSPGQVNQETSAGLKIVSIFQTNGMSSTGPNGPTTGYQTYFTAQQGISDAQEAISSAQAIGQPAGTPIYFAMDFDPAAYGAAGSEANLLGNVRTYLGEVNTALQAAGYKVGVYGAGDTLAAAIRSDPPVAQYGWLTQSYGWAGSNDGTHPDLPKNPPDQNAFGWNINQGETTNANGVEIDKDTAKTDDYGAWTVCYATGTLIRVARGETIEDVAVEDLKVGDLAITASGSKRPIKWIGQRTFDCAAHSRPDMVRPIQVKTGAFGRGRPYRDLTLSPHHAVGVTCIDDVLVPIRLLTNGTTIRQIEDTWTITYWHVELNSHDVLIANGLSAESYIDVGNRCDFEGEASLTLHPAFKSDSLAGYCRPLVTAGPVLAAIRAQLASYAEYHEAPALALSLIVDGVPIAAMVKDNKAAFVVPAGAGDIRLVSPAWSPHDADPKSADPRRLGILIEALAIDDMFGTLTEIPLDDARLVAGFHPLERTEFGTWRWTDGDALIAASVRAQLNGPFILRLTGQFDHSGARPKIADAA